MERFECVTKYAILVYYTVKHKGEMGYRLEGGVMSHYPLSHCSCSVLTELPKIKIAHISGTFRTHRTTI